MREPEIRILGRVELAAEKAPLPRKQAQVLAVLALNANRPTTVENMIDAVWEQPTDASRANLRTHVAALRRRLAGVTAIRGTGTGYLLEAGVDVLDEARYRALLAGRGERPAEVAARTGRALALWRGPALDGLRTTPALEAAAIGLEESRRSALARHVTARFALGEAESLVPLVRPELRAEPLQEGWYTLLIRLLDRLGRRAEAAGVYGELCDRLALEMGLAPSAEARALHARVVSGAQVRRRCRAEVSRRPRRTGR